MSVCNQGRQVLALKVFFKKKLKVKFNVVGDVF